MVLSPMATASDIPDFPSRILRREQSLMFGNSIVRNSQRVYFPHMAKKLFLLDGMALVYRAHFAFGNRPILTSKGVNTSALYGFTQTLLDIIKSQQPTHIAVAFDTEAPTQRHVEFPAYKAQREEMLEDLSTALPHVRR